MIKCLHYRNESESEAGISHVLRRITKRGKMTGTMDIRGVGVLFSLFQSELTPMTEPQQKPWFQIFTHQEETPHPHCSPNNTCQLSVMVLET